ncbi:hypothetical protein BOW52_10795 [Solemya elarraichensis gill symbiont]|uniref:Uncharacterized protein n=1 Tax=Solemya elarraichensis gill symbiont TaxID=1918949 RepID=A0A1T2KU97_9GAMM|nr:hypothetical protein BOW52_10795 [Solemya elarraichensis gill symbiont]
MEKALTPHVSFLSTLVSTDSRQRKALLRSMSSDQIRVLCEIALNVYRGNAPDSEVIETLRPHEATIRKLSKRGASDATKIKLMVREESAVVLMIEPFLDYFDEAVSRREIETPKNATELAGSPSLSRESSRESVMS